MSHLIPSKRISQYRHRPYINSTRPCIGHSEVQFSNNKERNDRLNKLIKKSKARRWHFPRKLRTYPTWIKGRIQAFNDISFQCLQRSEPKMFETREENGVSSPHVLRMISYAHTQGNHAKRDFLVKTCHFTPLGT